MGYPHFAQAAHSSFMLELQELGDPPGHFSAAGQPVAHGTRMASQAPGDDFDRHAVAVGRSLLGVAAIAHNVCYVKSSDLQNPQPRPMVSPSAFLFARA